MAVSMRQRRVTPLLRQPNSLLSQHHPSIHPYVVSLSATPSHPSSSLRCLHLYNKRKHNSIDFGGVPSRQPVPLSFPHSASQPARVLYRLSLNQITANSSSRNFLIFGSSLRTLGAPAGPLPHRAIDFHGLPRDTTDRYQGERG